MTSYRAILFAIVICIFISGCSLKKVGPAQPLMVYERTTFVNKATGETGLYVEGEDWHALIDLAGFEDLETMLTAPSQFLIRQNKDMIVSIFAEKAGQTADPEMCVKAPGKDMEKLNGKAVRIMTTSMRKSLHYWPFHNGYCFDFHFSMSPNKASLDKTAKILDSIRFINKRPENVRLRRMYYFYGKRVRMETPDTWQHSFKRANGPNDVPAIHFEPKIGNDFSINATIYAGTSNAAVRDEKARKAAERAMVQAAKRAVTGPVLKKIQNKNAIVYYFDATDKEYKPGEVGNFPYLRQGYASLDDSVVYFSIFFNESAKGAAKQGLEAIADSKIQALDKLQ